MRKSPEPDVMSDKRHNGEKPAAPSRREVWRMFDRIAPRYDLLNRLLSLGRDVAWRKRLADNLPGIPSQSVLDLATGTGDVLFSLHKNSANIQRAVGIDRAFKMLEIGREKAETRNLSGVIRLFPGDAMQIPAKADSFDAITIAFGIRNVLDVGSALAEMRRVLKPGGRALILEFSLPTNFLMKKIYLLYFRHVLPHIGGLISGDSHAYRYLNETVETFPYGQQFCDLMTTSGFREVQSIPLTFGIATIYRGDK